MFPTNQIRHVASHPAARMIYIGSAFGAAWVFQHGVSMGFSVLETVVLAISLGASAFISGFFIEDTLHVDETLIRQP